MKKTSKVLMKILALALALCLLLGLFPLSVSAAATYAVSFNYDYGKGFAGGMSDTGAVSANTRVTIGVRPNLGYEVNEVYYVNSGGSKINLTYGGLAVPGQNNSFAYYFTMPSENVTVCVTFKDAARYRVTLQQPQNGSVLMKGDSTTSREYLDLFPGTETNVYLYPENGYVLDSIRLVGNNGQSAAVGITSQYHTCRFQMPPYNATLIINYRPAAYDYQLTINQATGGYVYTSPSGDTFREDQYMRVFVNEDEAYRLESLRVHQNDVFLIDTEKVAFWYEFHMPSGNTTITPSFVKRREIEYIWHDSNRNVIDQKTGYEGRPAPETSVIPEKAADEEGEYAFDHWEEDYRSYDAVCYKPVFRRMLHAAAFQNITLSGTTVYPNGGLGITGNLIDMYTGERIIRKEYSFILMKNGETVFSNTTMTYISYNSSYNINNVFSVPSFTEPGNYTLRLYYSGEEGEAVYDTEITVLQPTKINISFTAPRQAAVNEKFQIEGTMTKENGEPIPNEEVFLRHKNTAGNQLTYTDSEGKFKTEMSIPFEGLTEIYAKTFNEMYTGEGAAAPIYISADDHSVTVTQTEHGSASAAVTSAKCGDTVTLTADPDQGYRLKEWEVVAGEITMDGDSFVMLTQDVEVKPVFEPNQHTVTIVLGDLGDDITVSVPYGVRFFNELDKEGVFNTLFDMETDDCIFRDIVTKPLAKFADEEEYSEDAWKLLDTIVTSDMTVYAGFYQKLRNVALTVTPPQAGTVVTGDWEGQTNPPQLTLGENAHCSVYMPPVWETDEDIFAGTIQAGATYYTSCILMPDFGYWLDENTGITVNGGTLEEQSGRMSLYVRLSVQATETQAFLLGDANRDGRVDIRDVTAIQRHLAEIEPLSEQALASADTNGDREVTIDDATLIQMYLAAFITKFPAEA